MSTPLETQLQQDATNHHLGDFINHLDIGLGNSVISAAASAHLKQVASQLLVDNKVIPNLQIDGDTGGKITLEDPTTHQQFLLSASSSDTAVITGADSKTYTYDLASNALVEKPVNPSVKYQGDANNPNEKFNKRDTDGKILSNADTKFDYDQAGTLTKVTWKNSDNKDVSYEKKANGWVDASGKPFLNDPVLDQHTGYLSFQSGTTDQPGNPTTWRPDASTITFDQSGKQVTSEQYANGDTRDFKYDANHKLNEVDYTPNGGNAVTEKWKLENDRWKNYDGSDHPTNKAPLRGISLDGDANYIETNSDGTTRKVLSDGVIPAPPNQPAPDNSDEKSMSLHQRWVKHHATEKAVIDQDVQASNKHTIAFGDTMWDIAKSSLKKNASNDHASVAEINAEIARLAKNNHIANPGSISVGTEIDTSPDQPPAPPTDANTKTGEKGQKIHFDGKGTDDKNITEIDYPPSDKYPQGMKVTFKRDADSNIQEVDITGGGDQDCTLVKNGDKFDKTNADQSTATVASIELDPDDGELILHGVKGSSTPAQDIKFEGDGSVESTAAQ
jgi:hypothetical protein